MNKKHPFFTWVILATIAFIPRTSFAVAAKTFTGSVTQIIDTQLNFKLTSGAVYTAQTPYVTLERRYGQAMLLSEFMVGDKIEVQGVARPDNSIVASSIRDMSLYEHTANFSGKVVEENAWSSSFTITSKTYGTQTVHVNNLTAFKINNAAGSLAGLQPGMGVTVKGMWDRSRQDLQAETVTATLKLIDIYFTGHLMVRAGSAFTITSPDNVMYAVDAGSAILQSKNSQTITLSDFNTGDSLRVWGKHVSGSSQVIATQVKDATVSK